MLSPRFNPSGTLPNGAANCMTSLACVAKAFVEGIHLTRTKPDVTKRAIAKYMRRRIKKSWRRPMKFLIA